MIATVRPALPTPLKRALKRGRRRARSRVQEVRSRVELVAAKRGYRKRYGSGFVFRVDPRDEMLQFMRDFWQWEFHVLPMRAQSDAMSTYLASGDFMMRDLEAA